MGMLDVEHLCVSFEDRDGNPLPAVTDVSFSMKEGSVTCLVGESGCGKSLTARACLRVLPPTARASGSVLLQGRDLSTLPERAMRRVRGHAMAMICQEPMTALNPVLTVGEQAAEPLRVHLGLTRREARERVVELFRMVGIPSPEERYAVYPHELSGGMRQRVMIAMALACKPEVLLADEPTTALDPTIQGQILAILRQQSCEREMAVLLITHDLGVVAQTADSVGIMYAGHLVEYGQTGAIFDHPLHPYTRGLMDSAPSRSTMHLHRLPAIPGTVPPLGKIPPGCPFHPRCPRASRRCREAFPTVTASGGHCVACWNPLDI